MRKDIRSKIIEIKNHLNDSTCSYETFNATDEYWEDILKELKNFPELETLVVKHPIYFKQTDKQYIYTDSKSIKKILNTALTKLLMSAESIIDALTELNEKSLTEKQLNIYHRKHKLIELLIKSGKIDINKLIGK